MEEPRDSTQMVKIEQAARILQAGDVVAMPTETVYGLAGDASRDDAVVKIFETKSRPRFNPLIVHCATIEMVETIAMFPPLARKLADKYWPGPLTMVLPKHVGAPLSDLVTAGLDTVAVRMPKHDMARTLIEKAGFPVAAPSANPSGKLSPTTAQHVLDGFDGRVPVLEGGPSVEGVESTIVAVQDDQLILLRPGTISRDDLAAATGRPVLDPEDKTIKAPGMLLSHYAPNATVRLNADECLDGEAALNFGNSKLRSKVATLNLSPSGDLAEAARHLFSCLRELDRPDIRTIAVAPISTAGLGEAINDRLRRAAADRS
ncbi:threonylcarbamoyl-AMP synthase [Maritalea sp. P4.10X]|uniref:Threonylcarbamoyl-AMP synthase n=2 Tax=Maritalea mediterranea TaxID=2909667 RepID=A0ABS9E4T6_9HYPH|nr:L-threonylcarbamoyladenylate synthase [Maritalea mediterranea]MCF4097885.1 threonylcarbamoyl-AMP synthase [Maritalea mediterranea]